MRNVQPTRATVTRGRFRAVVFLLATPKIP